MPQLNLALLFGEKSWVPFYYRKLPLNLFLSSLKFRKSSAREYFYFQAFLCNNLIIPLSQQDEQFVDTVWQLRRRV
ncbi:hypothetical protein LFYK43_02920 [Ligilactobacillus salitolerans]|uniref:Uncharacterized protein n=1 Tax=Ligilactobacillus salitolerans TaxID=1808352 RepID=A0A401IQP1_9LACO|nr:hypothetical protein LFYK43_02920 [Ligilactobacillus salitolerans]